MFNHLSTHENEEKENLNVATDNFYICKPKGTVPSPRSGHRAVATNYNLFIWGGYFPSRQRHVENLGVNFEQSPMLQELWRYNYGTNRWYCCPITGEYPAVTVASHAMCLYGENKIIVFGGTGYPFGEVNSNDLYVCDIQKCHWKRFSLSGEVPAPVYGSSLVLNGSKLYILCGTTGNEYNSCVYDVDLHTMECRKLCGSFSEPEDDYQCFGRYRQEVILYKNEIYVFGGGGITGRTYSLSLLPVFDLDKNIWKFANTVPDEKYGYPSCRKFHSTFLNGVDVYVFGGSYFDVESDVHKKTDRFIWKLDLHALTWKRTRIKLNTPLFFHSYAVSPLGQLWVHGGVIPSNNDVEKRTARLLSLWIRVPKLKDLVWSKLTSFLNEVMGDYAKETLYQLELPGHLIDRLIRTD